MWNRKRLWGATDYQVGKSRVGYRNPVLIWHWYLCNRYVLEPNQNADFSASFRCHAWAIVWNICPLFLRNRRKKHHHRTWKIDTQPQKRVDVTALLTHLRLCCQVCSHKVWWEKPNTLICLTLPPIRITVREEMLKPPPNNCNKKKKDKLFGCVWNHSLNLYWVLNVY